MKKYIYLSPVLIMLTILWFIFKPENNSIPKSLANNKNSIDFRNNFLEGCNQNKKTFLIIIFVLFSLKNIYTDAQIMNSLKSLNIQMK